MWLRYVSYLEGRRNVAAARAVLARAGSTVLPARLTQFPPSALSALSAQHGPNRGLRVAGWLAGWLGARCSLVHPGCSLVRPGCSPVLRWRQAELRRERRDGSDLPYPDEGGFGMRYARGPDGTRGFSLLWRPKLLASLSRARAAGLTPPATPPTRAAHAAPPPLPPAAAGSAPFELS